MNFMPVIASFDVVCENEYERVTNMEPYKRLEIVPRLDVKKPTRATSGSAGYDFYLPMDVTLLPGEEIVVPTFIKANINIGWALCIMPKSGLGFKYYTRLANTIGLVDQDFAYSDTDGNIMVKLRNEGKSTIELKHGDKFCQGVFLPFGITTDDTSDNHTERTGGFGSTGR